MTLPAAAHAAILAFRERLAEQAGAGPLTVAWAPGRVNLIGEHTDYNDGLVLPVAVDRTVALVGRVLPRPYALLYSAHHDSFARFSTTPDALRQPLVRRRVSLWTKYVRGVLTELSLASTASDPPGFAAAIAGNVPVGGGMSSSAALDVAVATFAAALGGPSLPPLDTAALCQRAEQRGAGVRVGILDPAASCLGRAGYALLLDCRTLAYEHIPVRLANIALAVYDTGVPRSLAGTEYNARREECERATALLAGEITRDAPERAVTSLRDVTEADLATYGATLPDTLLRRARHVVTENARVRQAAEALRRGDLAALGRLLYASHASLRDDYAVSCPELDTVVEIARTVPGVAGARMTGAGFGGSALILAHADSLPTLEATLAHEYPRRTRRQGRLHVCQIADGPGHETVDV